MLLGAAGVVLLIVAGLVAFGLYRKHQGHDVRGSSTEEFVDHAGRAEAARPPTAKIRWPMYRFDATRQGNAREDARASRPTSRSGSSGRARCVEFPPAVAYGRLYFANAKGVLFAVDIKQREDASGPTAPTAARPPRPRSTTTPST